jgi:hypothetical protein
MDRSTVLIHNAAGSNVNDEIIDEAALVAAFAFRP